MILHTVNKSPLTDTTFTSCVRCAAEHDSILLLEDGVYGALTGTLVEPFMAAAIKVHSIYVLQEDLKARGLDTPLIAGIQIVDYAGFVDLTVEHSKVHSWF